MNQNSIHSKTITQKVGEIKTFLDKPKVKEFVPSIPALKEKILMRELPAEMRRNKTVT